MMLNQANRLIHQSGDFTLKPTGFAHVAIARYIYSNKMLQEIHKRQQQEQLQREALTALVRDQEQQRGDQHTSNERKQGQQGNDLQQQRIALDSRLTPERRENKVALSAMTPDEQIAYIAESLQNSSLNDRNELLKSSEIQQVIQNITNSQISEIQNKFQLERDTCHQIRSNPINNGVQAPGNSMIPLTSPFSLVVRKE